MIVFVVTVFLGAFLLFQVQPLLGRYILPWFGGGPSVWTSCLLFFQTLLLGGYAYAHLLATRLTPRWQGRVHLIVLAISLLALPIDPNAEVWRDLSSGDPTGRILLLLLATAGLPYVVLSATSPLLQRWFHSLHPERSAYRLYALSNAGSLLALLSYPFVFEPLLSVRNQAAAWSSCYAAFTLLCGWCAWTMRLNAGAEQPTQDAHEAPPSFARISMWLALSACGSALLLSTTNQMSQEVAVVPFLWVLPLAVYLLSFILCFESDRRYNRRVFGFLLAVGVPASCAAIAAGGLFPLEWQILIFSCTLFAGCMTCHGELALLRPHGSHATRFYLLVALGGALGGLFVAVLAPRLFNDFWEFPLSLGFCLLAALIGWTRGEGRRPPSAGLSSLFTPPPALAMAAVTLLYSVWIQPADGAVSTTRNFYGVLRVSEGRDAGGEFRRLTHGKTEHGAQYLDEASRRRPTTYFGPGAGAELALTQHPKRLAGLPLHIGVVGLGAGTLAAYGRPGDQIQFYEINPRVVAGAQSQFTFLSDSQAEVSILVGDARIQMEQELERSGSRNFDLLAVDAFTSGAIPVHLLTAEAGEIYARHITEDGLLLFHITNRFLDLDPVLRAMAARLGMTALRISNPGDEDQAVNASLWMILTRNASFLENPIVQSRVDPQQPTRTIEWTDDFAGLWQALR